MISYSEDWLISLLFKVKGSVAQRAIIFALPCAIISGILVAIDDWAPDLREDIGLKKLNQSVLWSATTAILGLLLSFRTNRAMARFWEGTGLLHQMRGEWFDSISCCVTFSVGAREEKPLEVRDFRHTAVRLMSLCHGSALEEIAGGTAEEVDTIDPFGLDDTTLDHLNACKMEYDFNRVEVLLHMTQTVITKALADGILKIPPPILSRVYQTLSRGFVNLLNAKKIADTRFPFPYAQLITILLFTHTVVTPVLVSSFVPNKVWAPIFTFVPIFAMFSINFIGVELENPFGSDDNDLPLDHFQGEMNKCLLMLLHQGADLIPGVDGVRCITDYDQLESTMHDHHNMPESGPEGRFPSKRLSMFSSAGAGYTGNDSMRRGDSLKSVQSAWEEENPDVQAVQTSLLPPPEEKKSEEKAQATFAPPPREPESVVASGRKAPPEESGPAGVGLSFSGRERQTGDDRNLYPKPSDVLDDPLADYGAAVIELRELVANQLRDLSQSIRALKEFSIALPLVIDSMLALRTGQWKPSDYAPQQGSSDLDPRLPSPSQQLADMEEVSRQQKAKRETAEGLSMARAIDRDAEMHRQALRDAFHVSSAPQTPRNPELAARPGLTAASHICYTGSSPPAKSK